MTGTERHPPAGDVALLPPKRVPDGVKPVKLGDSDKVQIGEQVFVIGTIARKRLIYCSSDPDLTGILPGPTQS